MLELAPCLTWISKNLLKLLKILSENPIGLKLNSELSKFLGIFYKYHIIVSYEWSQILIFQFLGKAIEFIFGGFYWQGS